MQGDRQYRMNSLPRGLCVLINNRDFKKEKGKPTALGPREGTDKDRDALKATFEELLFEVRVHENLTDKQMLQTLSSVADEDHSHYDCFACCILSYGDSGGVVLGTNGHPVKIRSLTSLVKTQHCGSLGGKPKAFFIQACSRTAAAAAAAGGGTPSTAQAEDSQETAGDKGVKLLPNEKDYVMCCCTKPGFVHPKAKENGSLYVQKLIKLIKKYGNSHDILEILTRLNDDINEKGAGGQAADARRQELALTRNSLRMKLHVAPSPRVEDVRLMVIGKSKRGKSSTANTLVGRDLFPVNSSFQQNLFTGWHRVSRDGRTMEITEMPTELESDEAVRPLIATTPGPHVILLCFRCEQLFTRDDFFAYSSLKKWLGKHFCKYVILVFSGLDNAAGRGTEDARRESFASILRELPSADRLVCLDNKADWDSRRRQGERLLRLVDRVVQENSGGHFSNRKIRELEVEVMYQQSRGRSREDVKRRVVAGDEIEVVFRKQCCVLM